MTVLDMINELKKFPQDLEVEGYNDEMGYCYPRGAPVLQNIELRLKWREKEECEWVLEDCFCPFAGEPKEVKRVVMLW